MPAETKPKKKKLTGSEILERVKVGDTIETLNDKATGPAFEIARKAGVYQVVSLDRDDLDFPVKVQIGSDERWLRTSRFVRIVTRDGKLYPSDPSLDAAVPVAAIDPSKPLWEQVLKGDKIKTVLSNGVKAGIHVVRFTDSSLKAGPRSLGVNVERHGWIFNDAVKEIVERDGKPFGVAASTDVVVVGELAAEADAARLWAEVRPGDRVRISGDPDARDGDYTVTATDEDAKLGPGEAGIHVDGGGYVFNRTIRQILERDGKPYGVSTPAVVATISNEPLWKQVKVGDLIRVKRGRDHTAGSFRVTRTKGGLNRNAINYEGRNGGVWWVMNDLIDAIIERDGRPYQSLTTIDAEAKSQGVRGNFLIHVDVPTIMANKASGTHRPVTAVRRIESPAAYEVFRELAWDGPTRFVHHEFMKIEGTDIQNWIETDGPITSWSDDAPLKILTAKPEDPALPMLKPILGAFVIHIAAPVLIRNRQEGRNDPVIAVRLAHSNWADDVFYCRKVEWSGPTRMVHRPSTPVPGTNGRGVAFVETDAVLTLTMDNAAPMVLRVPAGRLAA